MMSTSDANKEFENELNRYRSQHVVIGALTAVKDGWEKIDSHIVQAINVTQLSDDLNMNREEVDSLFGTKLSSKPLEPLQKAILLKHLTAQITAQWDEMKSFVREIQQEEKFNVFRMDDVRVKIQRLLREYNEKLVQLINLKEKVCDLESQAVKIKSVGEQRKLLELFQLEVKSKIIENERLKRIMLHWICNQTTGNTEALLKLKEFVEDIES